MVDFTDKEIKELMEDYGWNEQDTRNGYAIFEVCGGSTIIDGALMVEAIGELCRFEDEGDFGACRQAERDGVKFINDIDGLEKGCYVDTKRNREHCKNMLKKYPELRIENQIKNNPSIWKTYIEYFG